MSKLVVDQLQHNGGQAFELPLNHPAVQSVLVSSSTGALSFVDFSALSDIKVRSANDPDPADTNFNVGDLFVNTTTGELFVCTYKSAATGKVRWAGSNGSLINYPTGEQMYASPGTYSFTVPDGVYSLGAVLVGGGGGGHYGWANSGGGGGALAYVNNLPVTPGEVLTVVVGAGGSVGNNGSNTLIKRGSTVVFGAAGGRYGATSESYRAKPIAGTVTPLGGAGGLCAGNGYGGGGGAGGYGARPDGMDACGGDGQYGIVGANYGSIGASSGHQANRYGQGINGAGGGGIGYDSSTYGFGGGGGVGLFGRGASGGQNPFCFGNNFYDWFYGGMGGSLGGNGASNNNSSHTMSYFDGTSWQTYTGYHGEGGRFGGGGGGGGTSVSSNSNYCHGGSGGARLVWGVPVDFTNAVPKVSSDTGVV